MPLVTRKTAYITKYCFHFLFFIYISSPSHADSHIDKIYLHELIKSAQEKSLSQRNEWRKLLHYKPRLIPGTFKSQVDAADFFLADNGKNSPESELNATLAGFFQTFPEQEDAQQLHPQCRFVARYQWLKKELEFNSSKLIEYPCKRFEEWMTALNPRGITLIFPSAYMNNPASMFGHTLLRIDAKDQTEKTSLLSYALNFGANTGSDNGLAFALKGLMGGYPGVFSVQPYYLKVREYSDMESRAIWEYQLNLSQEESRLLLMHAWELRGIWFDYYFFDENCSYHLLSLLETARPDLNLTQQFNLWAIPSDTVRAVVDAGLINATVYRPSRNKQLTSRINKLSDEEINLMHGLAEARLKPDDKQLQTLSIEKQAALLETAHEYVAYKQENNNKNGEQLQHQLLQARSKLSHISPPLIINEPAIRPDQGHDTAQLIAGVARQNHLNYQTFELRPAYQDLLDPLAGYTAGAQINFFSLKLHRQINTGTMRLQHFIPVDIISLSPVSGINQPISWQFNFGLQRKQRQIQAPLLFKLEGGAGKSWSLAENTLFYGFWQAELNISDKLAKGFTLGTGPEIGIVIQNTEGWGLKFSTGARTYPLGEDHSENNINFEIRRTITASSATRLKLSKQRELGPSFNHAELSWQWFF